jgi:hypothetical protein
MNNQRLTVPASCRLFSASPALRRASAQDAESLKNNDFKPARGSA